MYRELKKKAGFCEYKSGAGFTLLELVIFMAIFTLIAVSFVAVLISILRVQNRETSLAEVNRQSQFIMTTLQRYIEESSLIKTEVSDTPTSTLVLRMASSSDSGNSLQVTPYNPAETFIYLANGKIYLKEFQNGDPQPLTSDRVIVDQLDFKKHYNPGGHDSVDIVLSLHYNSPNIQKRFAQLLQTSVARINAATFDSDIMPSSTLSSLNIGSTGSPWKSINGIINFANNSVGIGTTPADSTYKLDVNGTFRANGNANFVGNAIFTGNVGINDNSPTEKLTVNGNIRIYNGVNGATCSLDYLGTIAFFSSDGGQNDRLSICARKGGVYNWIYFIATTTVANIY